ncbi:MAG: TIGR01777 family oxidoreductase [Streptosporangiaceae bacterium]
MRVAISAASGLIGSALASSLAADGAEVLRLVRRDATSAAEIGWDPASQAGGLDPAALAGVDAVVHLSGAPIASGRWTSARKAELRASRIGSTAILATAMAAASPRPAALVCASAIGYYGDTGDRVTDEDSPPGDGFLAGLVRDWEAAAGPAREAGVRVAHFRSGVVLSRYGGMLGQLLRPFQLGLGAKVGSGRQYFSWISRTDEVRAIRFLLDNPQAEGAYNLTAPEPVTNAEFTRALAAALHRPALLALPSAALRTVLGEVASELLGSQRVVPARLLAAGFSFEQPDIVSALARELGR